MIDFTTWLESQFQRQKDVVFRKTDRGEWEQVRSGLYSGTFWSSDPDTYGDFEGMILMIAKRSNSGISLNGSQIRGMSREEQKLAFEAGKIDYYNLDRKELADIIAAYEYRNGQHVQIYPNQ